MIQPLPSPVARYLTELEQSIKQRVGVVPEDALSDAREHLTQDLLALQTSEPGLSETEVYQHFVESFGEPGSIAEQYEAVAEPGSTRPGYAPGWRICCTRCGRSAPAEKAGIVRIAARSSHKYVVGWCRDCGWFRWLRLQRDLEQGNLTQLLGAKTNPEELRSQSHRPWMVIVLIVSSLIALGSIATWIFIWRQFFMSQS